MIYHNFIFFAVDKDIKDLPEKKLQKYKTAFADMIANEKKIIVFLYTTLGFKGSTIFLLWIQADSPRILQDSLNKLLHTSLGKYLRITHTLFGMSRPSQYTKGSINHLETRRKGGEYLIIYPFTKTKEWYFLDYKKRKNLMQGHMAIGRKYPQITQLLLYSFGVDDSEFIVSYETDNLSEFQSLVMELRSDPVRAYTQSDTSIFTCIYRPIEEVMDFV